jgi:two-component system sensor histidine kinase YesM
MGVKILSLSLFTAFIVGIVSIIGFNYGLSAYDQLLHQQTSIILNLYSARINAELMVVDEVSGNIVTNREVQTCLFSLQDKNIGSIERYRQWHDVQATLDAYVNKAIVSAAIVTSDEVVLRHGAETERSDLYQLDVLKEMAPSTHGSGIWIGSDRSTNEAFFIREIRKTNTPEWLSTLGYLILRVDFNEIIEQSISKDILASEHEIYLYNDADGVFFSTFEDKVTPDISKLSFEQGYAIASIDDKYMFFDHYLIDGTKPHFNVLIGIHYDYVQSAAVMAWGLELFVIVLSIMIVIAVALIVKHNINQDFNVLVNKFIQFKSGDLTTTSDGAAYHSDELGLLNQYFDGIVQEWQGLINDLYVKELAVSKARFKNLEAQVHPHFLYNSLETVKAYAKLNGEENIPKIIESLSRLLRYSLSDDGDTSTLRQEILVLEDYMTIQKIRFRDLLTVKYHISADTLDTPIPKMSLQPLVDNAIAHGMEESAEGCHIEITSKISENAVIVSVINDGSQIEEDILSMLRDGSILAHGNGVGLLNIDERLKLLFGEGYGLKIINLEDGVKIEIWLPRYVTIQ